MTALAYKQKFKRRHCPIARPPAWPQNRPMTTHPIDRLFATIASRKNSDSADSYTAKLLAKGRLKCAKKLGEEAIETSLAAVAQDKREDEKERAEEKK